jgi:hypothetical protein
MPTASIISWSNQKLEPVVYPETARTLDVAIEPAGSGTTVEYARGTVMGIVTATGKWVPYDDDGSDDGRRVARGILAFDISVDDAGKITYTTTAGRKGGEHGETFADTPVYISGYFQTSELTGLDANGAADLGRLVTGDTSSGVLAVA